MTKEKNISTTKPTGLSPILDDSDKYRDADRIEEADSIPLTPAQKNLVEHIEAGIKSHNERDKVLQWEDLSNRGDSFSEYPYVHQTLGRSQALGLGTKNPNREMACIHSSS